MGTQLALAGRTILKYITAIPGLLSHMAMEATGDALMDTDPAWRLSSSGGIRSSPWEL